MDEGKLIGAVTVTYNSADVLPAFLRCMAGQTHRNFLLFAVDNASIDETLQILRECSDPRLRILANPDNCGFAAGSNQGIRDALAAGCTSILLINNDTEFDSSMIAQLAQGLEEHGAWMACPKMMYYDDPQRIWAAGGAFQPWLGYRSIHFGESEIDHGQFDRAKPVTFVPGCCVLINKAVFEKIGFLDERYFVYVEDADFMYRAMKASVRLMYIPEAKLLHKVGRLTGGKNSPFATQYGTRNRIFFLLKHFGLACTLPWIAVCQVYFFFQFLFCRKGRSWLSLKQKALRSSLAMYRENSTK